MPIVNNSSVSSISDVNIANAMIEGLTSKRLQNNISIPFNRRIQGGPIVTIRNPKPDVLFPPGFSLADDFVGPPSPNDLVLQALANFYGLTVDEFCRRNPAMCQNPLWGLVTVGGQQFNEGTLLSLYAKWLLDQGSMRSNFYKLLFCNGGTPCNVWDDGILGGVNKEWLKENNPIWFQGYEAEKDMFFLRLFAGACETAWDLFNQKTKDKILNYILSVLTEMKTAWGLSEQQKAYIEMIKQLLQSGAIPPRCLFKILYQLLKKYPCITPSCVNC